MRELLGSSPWQGSERYVFYSMDPEVPMDQSIATRALYAALERIGIVAEERRRRRLDLHT
jgi:hypothetical protein